MCSMVNIKEDYDVYIGRGCCPKTGKLGRYGNPFSHLEKSIALYKVEKIEEALEKFEEYLLNDKELFNSLHDLKYKKLACWCTNKSKCHGIIIKKYVDKLEREDERKEILNF